MPATVGPQQQDGRPLAVGNPDLPTRFTPCSYAGEDVQPASISNPTEKMPDMKKTLIALVAFGTLASTAGAPVAQARGFNRGGGFHRGGYAYRGGYRGGYRRYGHRGIGTGAAVGLGLLGAGIAGAAIAGSQGYGYGGYGGYGAYPGYGY